VVSQEKYETFFPQASEGDTGAVVKNKPEAVIKGKMFKLNFDFEGLCILNTAAPDSKELSVTVGQELLYIETKDDGYSILISAGSYVNY
jgi:hypothetical protein